MGKPDYYAAISNGTGTRPYTIMIMPWTIGDGANNISSAAQHKEEARVENYKRSLPTKLKGTKGDTKRAVYMNEGLKGFEPPHPHCTASLSSIPTKDARIDFPSLTKLNTEMFQWQDDGEYVVLAD